ncbi:carbohydrate ABC transporter permease [Paenibacillus piri]|uniref:Carbohydrate ABC transporter permease n=2 Tax=Paenibacillus piri TaxID=2547395 RepID=A0A4V2ZTY9_9BACL|nr:carbohydrate ABC transporter permease [Paenibacillus piri]
MLHKLGDLLLLVIGLLFTIPLIWVVISSLKEHATLSVIPLESFTWTNYIKVFSPDNMKSFLNSIYLSFGTMLLTVIIAALAAYPLSRFSLPFKNSFVYAMIFSTGLPMVALMVPVYEFYVSYGMINSLWSTILFMAATSLPFATWMMKGFIDAVPRELEESASVEGCSTFQALLRIVAPLVIPGASVVGIYTFVHAWGNFITPFILLQGDHLPAAVTIYQFFSQYTTDYSGLATFSIIYTLPVIILYAVMTKWLGGGFTLGGAVKG